MWTYISFVSKPNRIELAFQNFWKVNQNNGILFIWLVSCFFGAFSPALSQLVWVLCLQQLCWQRFPAHVKSQLIQLQCHSNLLRQKKLSLVEVLLNFRLSSSSYKRQWKSNNLIMGIKAEQHEGDHTVMQKLKGLRSGKQPLNSSQRREIFLS